MLLATEFARAAHVHSAEALSNTTVAFDATLGFPGEGPPTPVPMECDELLPSEAEERELQRQLDILIKGVRLQR